jgi:hypothetical protein
VCSISIVPLSHKIQYSSYVGNNVLLGGNVVVGANVTTGVVTTTMLGDGIVEDFADKLVRATFPRNCDEFRTGRDAVGMMLFADDSTRADIAIVKIFSKL